MHHWIRTNITEPLLYARARVRMSARANSRVCGFGDRFLLTAVFGLLMFAIVSVAWGASPAPSGKSTPINAKEKLKSLKAAERQSALDMIRRNEATISFSDLKRAKDVESDPLTRYRFIQAIGAQNHEDVVSVLIDSLKNDPDSLIRSGAAQELGNYGQSSGVAEALVERLLGDVVLDVKIACARSLGLVPSLVAVPALQDASRNDDPNLRRQIAKSLGRHQTPEAKAALKRLQNDVDSSVRIAAGGKE